MRISEILFWNDEPTEGDRPNPQSDLPPASCSDFLPNLSNAFTRRGLVKHLWNLNGTEGEPAGLSPPDAETELIPNGALEPTAASWKADPVETEPPMGQRRFIPFRQYWGASRG
jgi:hypothetical protein